MSGNFDYPPASRPSAAAAAAAAAAGPRGGRQLLHQRLREFNTLRAQVEAHGRPASHHASPTERRPPPIPASRRPFISRVRRRGGGPSARSDSPTALLMEDYETLRSMADGMVGDYTPPPPMPYQMAYPGTGEREALGEADTIPRRKRRKIEHEDRFSNASMNGFRYGDQGSVVPGPLRMEIESCDGGVIPALSMHGQLYAPDNVLRNDRSVYCTNHRQCNIVLKHYGQTNFTLTKLVIKAPEKGFTAPIQEGLVFVHMESNELLRGTTHYAIRYPSPKPRPNVSSAMDQYHRPLSRRHDSSGRQVPPPISDSQPRATVRTDHLERPADNRNRTSFPPDSTSSSNAPLPSARHPSTAAFQVTTHCDPPSSDEQEPDSPRTFADRARRDTEPPPDDHDTSDDEDVDLHDGEQESVVFAVQARMLREARQIRGRRRVGPSTIDSTVIGDSGGATVGLGDSIHVNPEDLDNKSGVSEEAVRLHSHDPLPPGLLTPTARFFIEKDKSVVSIKFDPPVAGKFILLKLYSPFADTNIDVQSIIAHGFAGPRYFSAEEFL